MYSCIHVSCQSGWFPSSVCLCVCMWLCGLLCVCVVVVASGMCMYKLLVCVWPLFLAPAILLCKWHMCMRDFSKFRTQFTVWRLWSVYMYISDGVEIKFFVWVSLWHGSWCTPVIQLVGLAVDTYIHNFDTLTPQEHNQVFSRCSWDAPFTHLPVHVYHTEQPSCTS